jgi:flagellar hook-associated protein 2
MTKTEILSNIGVGSGINTTELIKALVDADTAPQKENLDNLEEKTKDKISTFGVLKSNLQDFKNILKDIQTQQEFGYVGSSSDATVATLTATGSSAGSDINSSLTVTTLASSHTLTGPTLASPSSTVGQRNITINFGTWSADPTASGGQSFTSNGQSQISVAATSSTTLTDLRDAINSAATDSDNDGTKDVAASIIYDGSNYMLMLKSESGASNEMKVTDSHSTPAYAYDTTDGAQLTQRVAGVNSAFTVDGISMTRSSNSVDDLFSGFTLDLKKTSGSPIIISSSVDLDGVTNLLTGYVETYNQLMTNLTAMGTNDPIDNENDGALIGDSTLREIRTQLREMSSTAIKGYEGGPYYLSYLGVSTNRDGSLNFNKSQMETQFKSKPETVRAFFTNNYSTSNSNIDITAFDFKETKPGSYAFSTDGSTHTIGGVSATKSGDVYSVASGDPKGLGITVANGSGVTSGTIYFGKSFINQVTDKLDVYLKFNSILDQRVNNLNDTLATVAEKRSALEGRIESITQRYARQYSAMESTVASFQETGNMLTAMLEKKD